MFAKILVPITLISIIKIDCYFLQAESNFFKPKLERSNILNKGIWVRNKLHEQFIDRNNLGNFIFRPNSLDVENVMQNNFEYIDQNAAEDNTPFMSSYIQRTRRSPDHIRKRRPRKSIKSGKIVKSSIEDSVMIKSKLVSKLKPSSVFNEYPYEIAILLNDEVDKAVYKRKKEKMETELKDFKFDHVTKNNTDIGDVKEKSVREEEFKIISLNSTETNMIDNPKRTKKFDYGNKEIRNFNIVEGYNKTEYNGDLDKQERHISKEKINMVWKAESPEHDNNFYKIVPKEPERLKPVTEKGLIKVISMLTKTFKKIMKQHHEIINIHDKLLEVNKNFDKKISELNSKFEDFDSKYSDMIQFNNKLNKLETEIKLQKECFKNKQKEINNSFAEFQDQQKKFVAQQKQFYSIQKLMLAQNEKINEKQNLIAQTQSQISHRQNNFARILKKAKQILNDNNTKLNNSYVKQEDKVAKVETTVIPISTTAVPHTEVMKINLFAIPTTKNRVENQDAQIIKEKDDKQIDELVYKYYFNNTFIDSLMKSKILNTFASSSNNVDIINRSTLSKFKRNELENTVMIPVNNSKSDTPLTRKRRWINHFSKNKYRRLNRHKIDKTKIIIADEMSNDTKINKEQLIEEKHSGLHDVKSKENVKSDPFSMMAMSFCKEIGYNENEQSLKWCVEKALRKLKHMEMNSFTAPTPAPVTLMVRQEPLVTAEPMVTNEVNRGEEISTLNAVPVPTYSTTRMAYQPTQSSTLQPVSKVTELFLISTPNQAGFFPDNDELESNLHEYELTPDTEGNVYYDGSLHISDYKIQDSGAISDIMPGLMDSNSKVDIDPMTFTIQANRRAHVRRMNENIMKQMRED